MSSFTLQQVSPQQYSNNLEDSWWYIQQVLLKKVNAQSHLMKSRLVLRPYLAFVEVMSQRQSISVKAVQLPRCQASYILV